MRLDSDRQEIHWYLMNYDSVNFTSAELYLHRDCVAGLQLWHIMFTLVIRVITYKLCIDINFCTINNVK